MKEVKILVDENCKHCKKGLAYLKKLYKRNENAYGSFILHTITLIPDYNSEGHLTHFHIEEQKC